MKGLVLVIHNVRSVFNVGSMLRTAEGLGVEKVYMTGYTPYPETKNDKRLPHERQRIGSQIHKTALGAESFLKWDRYLDIFECLNNLTKSGYLLVALEQTPNAVDLNQFKSSQHVALIVGNEINGLDDAVLNRADQAVQIPMNGQKESFNVAVAAGIAMYHFRYGSSPRQN